MKNTPHEPQQQPPADGPLARLVDDEESAENPAPAHSLPLPPEAGHGRDDYAAGTPEHDDDREL
jgi:hypothetical protein